MPPLLFLHSEEAYRARFRNILVRNEITTFHGVPVKFRNESFRHAFLSLPGVIEIKMPSLQFVQNAWTGSNPPWRIRSRIGIKGI